MEHDSEASNYTHTNVWVRDERISMLVMKSDAAEIRVAVFEDGGKWYWCLCDEIHAFYYGANLQYEICDPFDNEEDAKQMAERFCKSWLSAVAKGLAGNG